MIFHGAVNVSQFETLEEKLEAAGLNFDVEKTPVFHLLDGEHKVIPNQHAIRRTDNNMIISSNTVSDGYKLLQNKAAFSWLLDLDEIASPDIEYAGSFKDGALVYVMVKQNITSTLDDGSVLTFYVHLTNGHVGNKSLVARPLVIATKDDKSSILGTGSTSTKIEKGIRHTKSMHVGLLDGKQVFTAFAGSSRSFINKAKALAEKSCTEEQAIELFKKTLALPEVARGDEGKQASAVWNRIDKFIQLFNAAGGSTYWNAYHATCEYITAERATRRSDENEDINVKRMESTLYSNNSRSLTLALSQAVSQAEA